MLIFRRLITDIRIPFVKAGINRLILCLHRRPKHTAIACQPLGELACCDFAEGCVEMETNLILLANEILTIYIPKSEAVIININTDALVFVVYHTGRKLAFI